MTYEFVCAEKHLNSLRFSTIGKAIAHFESPDNPQTYGSVPCEKCEKPAARIYASAGTLFYGEGWDKPAPSGRQSTVGSDPTKAISSLGPPKDRGFLGRR